MASQFLQIPADLGITLVAGDELSVGLNFTAPSGNTTAPINLTGYTFDAKVFVPEYKNATGGFGSGGLTIASNVVNLTVSPVNLASGQLSVGLNETQTSALNTSTGYRWYMKWQDTSNLTLTVLSGDFVARIP